MKKIAITGSKGKTTSTYFTYQLLTNANRISCMTSTAGNFPQKYFNTDKHIATRIFEQNTSDLIPNLEFSILESFAPTCRKFSYPSEVDVAVFTNFDEFEHEEIYNKSIDYFLDKRRLFHSLSEDALAIININDSHSSDIISVTKSNIITYGVENLNADYNITNIKQLEEGISFNINDIHIQLSVDGDYNAMNYTVAYIIAKHYGIENPTVDVKLASGRYEKLIVNDKMFIVDFAHSVGSFDAILKSIKEKYNSDMTVVFGCGGQRSKPKRPEMLKTVLKYAKNIIITSDNCRTETFEDIVKDITINTDSNLYTIITDRKEAINYTYSLTPKIVCVLGMGNDFEYTYNQVKINHSDIECIKKLNK